LADRGSRTPVCLILCSVLRNGRPAARCRPGAAAARCSNARLDPLALRPVLHSRLPREQLRESEIGLRRTRASTLADCNLERHSAVATRSAHAFTRADLVASGCRGRLSQAAHPHALQSLRRQEPDPLLCPDFPHERGAFFPAATSSRLLCGRLTGTRTAACASPDTPTMSGVDRHITS